MGASVPTGTVPPDDDTVPILDCSGGLENLSTEIVTSLKRYGFLYLVNHGVSSLWINTALSEADCFFTLPAETKTKYQRKYNDFTNYHNFGDLDSGYTGIKPEHIQQMATLDQPLNSDNLRECYDVVFQTGQYLTFPDSVAPNFRPAALRLLKALSGIGLNALRAIGSGLHLPDPDYFYKAHHLLGHRGNVSALRFSHYPPIYDKRPILTYNRTGENVSFGTIILVLQDDIEGLEGTDSKGNFRPIPPLKNSILLTSGELLQRWTSNEIWAPSVRVRIPTEVSKRARRRNVIVYYMIPDNNAIVKPIDGSNRYDPVVVGEYMGEKYVKMYY